jgi:nucleoside-diphosphate-sugar epimerase
VTGFVGNWLLEGLSYADALLNLNLEVHGYSRNTKTQNTNGCFHTFSGDLRAAEFKFNEADIVLHFAASLPTTTLESVAENNTGTSAMILGNLLGQIKTWSKSPTIFHASSGGVYRHEPTQKASISEVGVPLNDFGINPYIDDKIKTEQLLTQATHSGLVNGINLRLFSFMGPGLALNKGYAAAQIAQSVLQNQEIVLESDGESMRSYMHPVDMVIWLMSAMEVNKAPLHAIHLGSQNPISIHSLANQFADLTGLSVVRGQRKDKTRTSYFPDTSLTRSFLKTSETIGIERSMTDLLDFLSIT